MDLMSDNASGDFKGASRLVGTASFVETKLVAAPPHLFEMITVALEEQEGGGLGKRGWARVCLPQSDCSFLALTAPKPITNKAGIERFCRSFESAALHASTVGTGKSINFDVLDKRLLRTCGELR
jgi:hypothetical protein